MSIMKRLYTSVKRRKLKLKKTFNENGKLISIRFPVDVDSELKKQFAEMVIGTKTFSADDIH